jgi:Lrp/AsnC family transcriptional regulator, leucine-responsive regulatory protein
VNGSIAEINKLLDANGLKILGELRRDARQTLSVLSRTVGMSLPAVSERIRRMEEAGIIRGYHAEVDLAALGYSMTVFIRMKTSPERYARFKSCVESIPEILECHHVSGEDSFVIKLVVSSIPHLEAMIGKLGAYGHTASSIVLSTLPQCNQGDLSPVL